MSNSHQVCLICRKLVESGLGSVDHNKQPFIREDQFLAVFKSIGLSNLSFVSDAWHKLRTSSESNITSTQNVFCSECTKLSESALESLSELVELEQNVLKLNEETLEDLKNSLATVHAKDHDVINTAGRSEEVVERVPDLKLELDDDDPEEVKVVVVSPSHEDASPDPFGEPSDDGTCSNDWEPPQFETEEPYAGLESQRIRLEADLLIHYGISDSFVVLQRLTQAQIQKFHRPIDRRSSCKFPRDASNENIDSGCTRSRKVYSKNHNTSWVKKAEEGQFSESENANVSVEGEVSTPECTFLYCKKPFETWLQVKVHLQQDHGLVLSESESEDEMLEAEVTPTEKTCRRKKGANSHSQNSGDGRRQNTRTLTCLYKNCPFRRKFALKYQLKRHMRKYHKRSMSDPCTVPGCLNPFFRLHSEEDKEIHMRLAHGPDPHPWKCPYCNKHFKNREDMLSHRETDHVDLLKLICHICGKRQASEQNMNTHMRTHTDEQRYSCEKCDQKFKSNITLRKHIRRKHQLDSGNQCEQCGGFFANFTTRECCSTSYYYKIKCMYCDERFRSLIMLNSHIAFAHEGMAFAEKLKTRRRQKSVEKAGRTLANKRPRKLVEKAVEANTIPVFCSVEGCENHQLFVSKAALILHVKDEHGMELTEADIDISTPVTKEKATRNCHFADCTSKETFKTDQDLHVHILKYHADKTVKIYSCDTCSERFTYQRDLKEHMLTHSDKPIYKCKECPRMYGTSGGLYLHIQTKHMNKTYPCEHCGASFSTNVYMKLHIESKHGSQERTHECDICGKKFILKTHLAKHRKRTHDSQYKCDHCGKSLQTLSSLRMHLESLHPENERISFQCKICNGKYKSRENLSRHMKLMHNAKFCYGLPSISQTV